MPRLEFEESPMRPPTWLGWAIVAVAFLVIAALVLLAFARPAQANYTVRVDAGFVGVYDVDAVADTDWHTLSSADFDDLVAADGTTLPAGLVVVSVLVVNQSGNPWLIKIREAAGAGDATDNRLRALANGSTLLPVRGLAHRSSTGTYADAGVGPKAISYKKGAAGDTGQLVVYFDRP